MRRPCLTIIALCALLTQALLGVGTGSVLCIKGGVDPCGPLPQASECSCCCAEETPPSPVIQLCTPCHDGCNDCVDVDLPDETLLAIAGAVELPAAAFLAMALNAEHAVSVPVCSLPVTGYGAGPPKRAAQPGLLIVHSTILLL